MIFYLHLRFLTIPGYAPIIIQIEENDRGQAFFETATDRFILLAKTNLYNECENDKGEPGGLGDWRDTRALYGPAAKA